MFKRIRSICAGIGYGIRLYAVRVKSYSITGVPVNPDGTGFLFERISGKALAATLIRAISHFQKPSEWYDIQKRGMEQDFSWNKSALAYADLYQHLMES